MTLYHVSITYICSYTSNTSDSISIIISILCTCIGVGEGGSGLGSFRGELQAAEVGIGTRCVAKGAGLRGATRVRRNIPDRRWRVVMPLRVATEELRGQRAASWPTGGRGWWAGLVSPSRQMQSSQFNQVARLYTHGFSGLKKVLSFPPTLHVVALNSSVYKSQRPRAGMGV
jgi:hypothetical protein